MKKNILISVALVAFGFALAACGTTAQQQATLTSGAVTLASVAAANNKTVADVVAKGALFCQQDSVLLPAVVALANAAGAPVSVTGQASSDVAQACAAIQAVPVPPPAAPGSVPVVASPSVALPAIAAPAIITPGGA